MQRLSDGSIQLELTDLIRMNQLIRSDIDLAGFVEWYETESRSTDVQVALLCHLHDFAQQAGGDEQTFQAAVQAAPIPEDHALIPLLASFRGDWSRELKSTLREWLIAREAGERRLLLPVLVYYFGLAERAVFARETMESCNHWWHRDLLDQRVVHDLMSNPEFFRTSMRDDLIVKRK